MISQIRNLSQNQIANLPANAFSGLTNVKSLFVCCIPTQQPTYNHLYLTLNFFRVLSGNKLPAAITTGGLGGLSALITLFDLIRYTFVIPIAYYLNQGPFVKLNWFCADRSGFLHFIDLTVID